MMKILVTGANGYLGRGIVEQIINDGNEVIATDFSVNLVNENATKIPCDLFSIDDPYEFFGHPDVVLHLAWRDGFVHNSNAHMEDLPKHYEFIKKLAESKVSRIAIMGSMHEVGFFEGSINENTICNPMNLYGISKDALRKMAFMLAEQNDTKLQWLRAYYIVSNTSYGNSIFSKIVSAVEQGKDTFPFTMGQNQYDFLDYDDFAKQVAAVVSQSDVDGIINICSGYPEKLADRVERFIDENNLGIKLQYGAFPDRAYDSKAVWGDSSKIDNIMSR